LPPLLPPRKRKMGRHDNSLAKAALVVFGLCTAAIPHCPAECVPTEVFTTIRDGVVEDKICDTCFQFCDVKTFYRDTLMRELKARYDSARHVIFGHIESLKRYQKYDTIYYEGDLIGVDTSEWESLTVSVFAELKGDLGKSTIPLVDSMAYISSIPYATSYRGYEGRPFLSFFDTLPENRNRNDSMGIGPVDGCFFEPQAFIISDSSIHKMGIETDRIPGVSVRVVDFFKAVGHPGAPIPTKKAVAISIRKDMPRDKPSSRSQARTRRHYWYDLKGRRLRGDIPGPSQNPALPPAGSCSWQYLH
jgi:hypothetical protein